MSKSTKARNDDVLHNSVLLWQLWYDNEKIFLQSCDVIPSSFLALVFFCLDPYFILRLDF